MGMERCATTGLMTFSVHNADESVEYEHKHAKTGHQPGEEERNLG
jgi:hypothetical protein